MNKNANYALNTIPLVNVADERALYDPDLPNANAVMAAICCVSSQYAKKPSADLAMLAADLAHQLTAPQYAESPLIIEVAKRLTLQWDAIVDHFHDTAMMELSKNGTRH